MLLFLDQPDALPLNQIWSFETTSSRTFATEPFNTRKDFLVALVLFL
jgi:hypothetical protein